MTPQLPAPSTPLRLGRLFISICAALMCALTALALIRAGVFYSLYTWLFAQVVEYTGLDLWASRAITLALLIILWFLPWHLAVLPWVCNAKRQVVSLTIIATAACIAMGIVTQDVYFSRADGRPLRYYIQTLDGYKFSATPGTDPVYGIPYQPITADAARAYIVWKARGGQIQDPSLPEGQYFNAATGEPLRWYARTPEGKLDFFTLPGFHPKYGTKLSPATPEVVAEYEKQQAEAIRQRQGESLIEQQRADEKAHRKAREGAHRNAKEVAKQKAMEAALLKRPLDPGRYVFGSPFFRGTIDGLGFTLTEVDLTAEKLFLHLNVENIGQEPGNQSWFSGKQRYTRFGLATAGGATAGYTAIRIKEGALAEDGAGSFSFPPVGNRGAFVMEFARPKPLRTFSLVVNEQPIFSGIDLRTAHFWSF